MGEDFSSRPLLRVVIICCVPILLELDERVRDSPEVADRGMVRIGKLLAAGFGASVIHLPMLEGAGEHSLPDAYIGEIKTAAGAA